MDKGTAFCLSLIILLPFILGLIRIRAIYAVYFPLIGLLGIGVLNELIGYYFFSNNAVPNNIYCYLDFVFWAWQFKNWGNILTNKKLYFLFIMSLTLLWVFENIVSGHIFIYGPWYRIVYSLVLVLLAVNQMNWLIINDRSTIYKNPIFQICIAIIVFYAYKILMEIFYHYAPEKGIQNNIFSLEAYVNIFFNIILAIAILCIPRKKAFIQPLR